MIENVKINNKHYCLYVAGDLYWFMIYLGTRYRITGNILNYRQVPIKLNLSWSKSSCYSKQSQPPPCFSQQWEMPKRLHLDFFTNLNFLKLFSWKSQTPRSHPKGNSITFSVISCTGWWDAMAMHTRNNNTVGYKFCTIPPYEGWNILASSMCTIVTDLVHRKNIT